VSGCGLIASGYRPSTSLSSVSQARGEKGILRIALIACSRHTKMSAYFLRRIAQYKCNHTTLLLGGSKSSSDNREIDIGYRCVYGPLQHCSHWPVRFQRRRAVRGPLHVGVDPAGMGADSTAIAWRRGRVVEKVEKRRGLDTMQVAGWVASIIATRPPSCEFREQSFAQLGDRQCSHPHLDCCCGVRLEGIAGH
jgi:hypothetical protein